MRPFIIGVGRAGCSIADTFLKSWSRVPYQGLLIDTDRSFLNFCEHEHKFLLGERFFDGNGSNLNSELTKEAFEYDKYNIVERIDSIKENFDCLLVIAGLGGGTGGAIEPLLKELKTSYTEPVYVIGILPSEEDLEYVFLNFSQNFKGIAEAADALFPVDNDRLKEGMRLRSWFSRINEKIFRYFDNIFEVGEYRHRNELGTETLSVSDVINTLKGISTVGNAMIEIKEESKFGFFMKREEKLLKPDVVISLTQRSLENTIIDIDPKSASKALVIVRGNKKYLDFLGSIPARLWIEKELGIEEVRGGDLPSETKGVEVTLLLSGIKASEKLRTLYKQGKLLKKSKIDIEILSKIVEKAEKINFKIKDLENEVKELNTTLSKILYEEEAYEN